jgi:hypothetical protein
MAISQITAASIADGTVVAADIAANAVTTVKIADSNVTTEKIANSAVTAAKLAPGAALSNGQLSIVSSSLGVVPDSPASTTPYKILGQIVGVANTDSNVYVVPASTNTVVNLITVCNGTQNNILIDLVARPSSEALATKHFVLKSLNIPAADTLVLDTGVTLPTSAILSANVTGANATSSAAGVAIHAYGVEIK